MKIIKVTQEMNRAEIAISGFLTFAKITFSPGEHEGWNIDLDDHKTGQHTVIPTEAVSMDDAIRVAGLALVSAAKEANLEDMDEILDSVRVRAWETAAREYGEIPAQD